MPHEGTCNSCGTHLVNRGSTQFPCPQCNEAAVGRCPQCRDQSVRYKCRSCGFTGP